MTRDEAEVKIKALWPQHEITGLPMSASGVLKILEALDLISFKEKTAKKDGVALKSIAHPEGETVAEDADINPDSVEIVEFTEEQVENIKTPSAPLKVAAKKKGAKKVEIDT